MKAENNTPKGTLKPWRASIFRKKLDRLGRIYAADHVSAEAVAAEEFNLDENERSRLLIEEVQ
jgi:hypothetical protein